MPFYTRPPAGSPTDYVSAAQVVSDACVQGSTRAPAHTKREKRRRAPPDGDRSDDSDSEIVRQGQKELDQCKEMGDRPLRSRDHVGRGATILGRAKWEHAYNNTVFESDTA
eukprot:118568_1